MYVYKIVCVIVIVWLLNSLAWFDMIDLNALKVVFYIKS